MPGQLRKNTTGQQLLTREREGERERAGSAQEAMEAPGRRGSGTGEELAASTNQSRRCGTGGESAMEVQGLSVGQEHTRRWQNKWRTEQTWKDKEIKSNKTWSSWTTCHISKARGNAVPTECLERAGWPTTPQATGALNQTRAQSCVSSRHGKVINNTTKHNEKVEECGEEVEELRQVYDKGYRHMRIWRTTSRRCMKRTQNRKEEAMMMRWPWANEREMESNETKQPHSKRHLTIVNAKGTPMIVRPNLHSVSEAVRLIHEAACKVEAASTARVRTIEASSKLKEYWNEDRTRTAELQAHISKKKEDNVRNTCTKRWCRSKSTSRKLIPTKRYPAKKLPAIFHSWRRFSQIGELYMPTSTIPSQAE